MMAEVQGEDMRTLLLVGRSGNGKSSVGNSIIGEKKFEIRSKHQFGEQLKKQVFTNAGVKVVDCTGIGDTGSDMVCNVHSVLQSAREVVENCVRGFDALIFVMKYGVRFTKQEKDAVQMVKSIFGENVFRDWGILVFSCGDQFDLDTKDDDIKFEVWCKEQTGDVKRLFEEVDYRCVVFDNKSYVTFKQRKQREELMGCVEKIQEDKRRCYSVSDFERAMRSREILVVQYELESLKSETDTLIREMNQSLNLTPVPNDHDVHLENMLQELLRHGQKLEEMDRNTGMLESLQTQVQAQVTMLQGKIIMRKTKTEEASVPTTDPVQELILGMKREPGTTVKRTLSFLVTYFRQ
ncbi:unnamed protein product [Lymnaea stagnalis]|uniref:AIG1-type G domain-containing protein n=1 Tax=Lymnaea stagnalis TaxID=6523 RepID=A0AAV2HMU9_LYMST